MNDDEIAKLTTTTEFYVGLLLAVSSSRKFRIFRALRWFIHEISSFIVYIAIKIALDDAESAAQLQRSTSHNFRPTTTMRNSLIEVFSVHSFHRKQFHHQEEGSDKAQ